MMKLKHLLLVDDDPTTNFFNEHLIGKMNIFSDIHVAENGQVALDKIKELEERGESPDMILLDINMPIMNGFEFLDQYEKLNDKVKSSVVVCMLTTSLAKEDLEKSKEYDVLSDYIDKPLYEAKMRELILKYFEE
jgi:CheY-like chemotaxis protein